MPSEGAAGVLERPIVEGETSPETVSSSKVLFLQHREFPESYKKFENSGLLPLDTPAQKLDEVDFSKSKTVVATLPYTVPKKDPATGAYFFVKLEEKEGKKPHFVTIDHLLPRGDNTPEVVIMHVPNGDSLAHSYEYRVGLIDAETNFNQSNRPTVILYTDGFAPQLYQKHEFQGVLFASTEEELQKSVALAEKVRKLRDKDASLRPEGLAPLQEKQYDASDDLREWEHKTADTYQSLKHILERIIKRDDLLRAYNEKKYSRLFDSDGWYVPQDSSLQPTRPIKTILDLGTGEGRIGGMLARLGFHVMGLDISQATLDRGKQRFIEEGEGLRGERDDPTLSYPAIEKLAKEDGIFGSRVLVDSTKIEPILDDTEALKHYVTTKGDFFNLHRDVHIAIREWESRYPGINKHTFFQAEDSQYAFKMKENMLSDIGFDMAMFNWHTFCEIGDPDNQEKVLHQIQNVLWPGGELVIEIPDRTQEPYASMIQQFHKTHPDKPFGTLQDPKPDGDGNFSARYFPGKDELLLLLQRVGFEVDEAQDVQTYDIGQIDEQTGEEKPAIKEYFITARKSRR